MASTDQSRSSSLLTVRPLSITSITVPKLSLSPAPHSPSSTPSHSSSASSLVVGAPRPLLPLPAHPSAPEPYPPRRLHQFLQALAPRPQMPRLLPLLPLLWSHPQVHHQLRRYLPLPHLQQPLARTTLPSSLDHLEAPTVTSAPRLTVPSSSMDGVLVPR